MGCQVGPFMCSFTSSRPSGRRCWRTASTPQRLTEQVIGKAHVKKAMAVLLLDLVYVGFKERRMPA